MKIFLIEHRSPHEEFTSVALTSDEKLAAGINAANADYSASGYAQWQATEMTIEKTGEILKRMVEIDPWSMERMKP